MHNEREPNPNRFRTIDGNVGRGVAGETLEGDSTVTFAPQDSNTTDCLSVRPSGSS